VIRRDIFTPSWSCAALAALMLVSALCCRAAVEGESAREVIIYTSLDQTFSEPVLKAYEEDTGVNVKVVYDTEATKTTGMVNRLIAEKSNPQADVFWNSETGHTIRLKRKGILAPYISPSAREIPAHFKDAEGYWTGFAARARVLIFNKDLISEEEMPTRLEDLTDPRWQGKFSMAYPLFGTTLTHSAALFSSWGEETALKFFENLRDNDVAIVDGNSTSRDRVVEGAYPFGLTDTDDANVAISQGRNVGVVFPDQDSFGTLLIPNTVALIDGGPNPEEGKHLIDYLLSRKVEERLAHMPGAQLPLREGIPVPQNVQEWAGVKAMKVDFEEVADSMEPAATLLKELFVR
jgi:iron(III) transport system substrate-binding protein